VTLRALRKSSEFGAILWLLLRFYDHERAGARQQSPYAAAARTPSPTFGSHPIHARIVARGLIRQRLADAIHLVVGPCLWER